LWTRWLHSWRGSVASGCESQHVDFARISGTVSGYPQGGSLCAILVIMSLAIVVMTMVIAMVIAAILETRVWDDRGGEERGS
jgi:hypothetical protein